MAKNSKRRRNGKLKKCTTQRIQLNHETSIDTVEVCKTILKNDVVNLPLRKDYANDQEGKRLFKEARKKFWASHVPIKKEVKRKRKVVKVKPVDELVALRIDEKRLKSIDQLRTTSVVQKGNAASGRGKCISFFDENGKNVRRRPTVTTSIELVKSENLFRYINHNSTKWTKRKTKLKMAA